MNFNEIKSIIYKNTKKNVAKSMSFKGVCEIRSIIKGRVRFYIPAISKDVEFARSVAENLQNANGIFECTINEITQSFLVVFDEEILQASVVQGALIKMFGLEESLISHNPCKTDSAFKTVISAIDKEIMNLTDGMLNTRQAVATTLFACGVIQVVRGKLVMPNPASLFWWSLNMMNKGGKL